MWPQVVDFEEWRDAAEPSAWSKQITGAFASCCDAKNAGAVSPRDPEQRGPLIVLAPGAAPMRVTAQLGQGSFVGYTGNNDTSGKVEPADRQDLFEHPSTLAGALRAKVG